MPVAFTVFDRTKGSTSFHAKAAPGGAVVFFVLSKAFVDKVFAELPESRLEEKIASPLSGHRQC